MLPRTLLSYRLRADGVVQPRWLEARDEVWLRELLAEIAAQEGQRVDVAEPRILKQLAEIARRHGCRRRVVQAVWLVERKRWNTRVASRLPPAHIRTALFPLAAERSRAEALATAAAALGIPEDEVMESLFADRPGAKRLVPPKEARTPSEVAMAYNLALSQGFLARSTSVVATVRANLRSVVGYARLRSLMASFEALAGGETRVSVSGPLALFHDTLKYGRALAMWAPAVMVTPGWRLEASVLLGKDAASSKLVLDGSAPLPRTHELPRAHDSKLEARLEADVRRLGSEWSIAREGTVLRAAGRLFFPDFVLTKDGASVHVEIVGFWTPEYLAEKAKLLERAGTPVVFCVDERFACGALTAGARANGAHVMTFRKRIDAPALLAECEQVRADRRVVIPPAPLPHHRIVMCDDEHLEASALAGGARAAFWMADVAADLTRRDGSLRVRVGPTHPAYGPLLALLGDAFYVEAHVDRRRRDALFVYRVVALSEHPAARAGPWREVAADCSYLDLADIARATPLDDVQALFEAPLHAAAAVA